jgi:hypothetical protein
MALRFSNIVVAYAVIGMVMWGGGAIAWENSGLGGVIIDAPDDGSVSTDTADELQSLGGPIQEAAATVGGTGLLAVWNILIKLLGFLFWPVVTMQGAGAPPRVWVLFGGTLTIAFYAAALRLIRSSA